MVTHDIIWKINRLLNQPWPYSDVDRLVLKFLLAQLAVAKRVEREEHL